MGPRTNKTGLMLAAALLGGFGMFDGAGRDVTAQPLRRNSGPLTDADVRARAAHDRACKPKCPNRSKKSKRKRAKGGE